MPVPDSPLPDWHRAHGKPLSPGIIKQEFSDFEVTEELGFELSDDEANNTCRLTSRLRLADPWRSDPSGAFVFRHTLCFATELVPTLPMKAALS